MQLPLGDDMSERTPVMLHFMYIAFCMDYLAKVKMTPFGKSTSSWLFCTGCHFDKRPVDAYKPFSFLQQAMFTAPTPTAALATAAQAQRSDARNLVYA